MPPRTAPFGSVDRLWERFIFHARVLQHVGPFPTRTRVAVLQVLSEVIRSEEFLRMVALAKFVHFLQMENSCVPVLGGSNGDRVALEGR